MKLIKLLLACCFLLAYSCSDSKNEVTPPNDGNNVEAQKQIDEIIDVIAQEQELSTFKEALAKVDAKKFTENEFTILAYKNKQTQSRATSATEDATLRHIIGGKYTFDALKKLKHIVALSKDTLHIKYSEAENSISLNGVSLGKSINADKSIVFVADSIIPLAKDTAVVEEQEYLFRVMKINANWTPENNSEDSGVAENVLITIYKDDKVIKELRTDKDGFARFSYNEEDIVLDYVVKTDTSSMLFDGYLVQGLFTSQDQIDESSIEIEHKPIPGGLKFVDINGDGLINKDDKLNKQSSEIVANETLVYLVGKGYQYPKNELEVTIDMAYDAYDEAEEIFAKADSLYSTLNDRKSLSGDTPLLHNSWALSYNAIININIVLDDKTIDAEDRQELEEFRANLHLNLSTLFGNVPIQTEKRLMNLPSNTQNEIYDFAQQVYRNRLDVSSDSTKYTTNAYINNMLVYRLQDNYSKVYDLAQESINSGTISLHPNFAQSDINAVRSFLLLAEASNELGNLEIAIQTINRLLDAEGKAPLLVVGVTQEKIRTLIKEFYNKRNNAYKANYDYAIKYNNIMSWKLNDSWDKYKLLPKPLIALHSFGKETLVIQNPGW